MSIDDLRLLRYFVATVDAGSANRASLVLHVGQPSLSRQLRLLERQLDLVLFEREGRGLRLSSAGAAFLPLARQLLNDADYVVRATGAIREGRVRRLQVAVPTTTLTDVVAPFLATLTVDDPLLSVSELDPRGADAALRAGADVAIVARPPLAPLAQLPLARLPVWAYVPATDAWATRQRVTVSELIGRPLLVMGAAFRPRELLDTAVAAAGLSYRPAQECSNAQVAQALAAARRGVAVVSDDPRFDLVPLEIVDDARGVLAIELYAAWATSHHAAEVIEALMVRLAEFCRQRYLHLTGEAS